MTTMESRFREALIKVRNLTRNQHLSPKTVRQVGERVQAIVDEVLEEEAQSLLEVSPTCTCRQHTYGGDALLVATNIPCPAHPGLKAGQVVPW